MAKNSLFKAGFTLIELLVVIAVLAVLSVAAYVGIQVTQMRGMNDKVASDLLAIENALNEYKNDTGVYPGFDTLELSTERNILCFKGDRSYAHDCEAAAFLQTQIDNILLTKRYLQELPTDPRSGTNYSYAVSADGQYFQVGGLIESQKGQWTAKLIDNVDEKAPYASMIRAYNSPNFVMDEGESLPYSPNPFDVTAHLHQLSGTVTVNAEATSEGGMMEAGDLIKTGVNSEVVLYLSDGSVTHLDADSTLQLLPNSEAIGNVEGNMLTKIKMKLLGGTVWNKVVRLAEGSEFNIETTNAIAGVRGTEFELDADTNELTVLSGTVAARLKTESEKAESNGEGQFMEYNVSIFSQDQEAVSDGNQFRRYTIPAQAMGNPSVLTPGQAALLREKYYESELGLSEADIPYIVKAQAHADKTYTLFVTFNGLESYGDLKVTGFEIYGEKQATDVRVLNGTEPLLILDGVNTSEDDTAYTLELNYDVQDNPLYDQGEKKMQSILLKAYFKTDEGLAHSQVSWPPIGLEPAPTEEYEQSFKNSELYPQFEDENVNEDEGVAVSIAPLEDENIALNEGVVQLTANVPCNWSVVPEGSGAFVVNEDIMVAEYAPLTPSLSDAAKMQNVKTRFGDGGKETVILRCEDPENVTNFDELQAIVSYSPRSVTDAYEYSYHAESGVSWTEANKTCEELTEGGYEDWGLPSKLVYENLNLEEEVKNLCDFDGNTCLDDHLEGAYAFWFDEIDNEKAFAFFIPQNKFSGLQKSQDESILALNCLRDS